MKSLELPFTSILGESRPRGLVARLPIRVRRGLRSFLEHPALKYLQNFYSGLGSCLLYHRIRSQKFSEDEASPYSSLTVTVDAFEEQARYLKKNYNCLSLPQATELLSKGELPRKSLVITFDDGYRDNLINALPILEKYDLPATIYVATGLIDRSSELWWYEQEFLMRHNTEVAFEWEGRQYRWQIKNGEEKYSAMQQLNLLFRRLQPTQQRILMKEVRAQSKIQYSYEEEILNWEELRFLDSHPLITIGAHTTNHPMLNQLSSEELNSELHSSKQRLESELGHTISHFAYPFGGICEVGTREFEAVRRLGFASAVTTRPGHLYRRHYQHLHSLPRISIIYDDSLASLAWKLSGMHSMLQQYGLRSIAA